jgi:hypothetical protein
MATERGEEREATRQQPDAFQQRAFPDNARIADEVAPHPSPGLSKPPSIE